MSATKANIAKGAEKREALADLLADGATLPEAGEAMGISLIAVYKHLARIRADLGWQAS